MEVCIKRFEQAGATIKGCILNGVIRKASSYYNYGYTSYGYSYSKDKDWEGKRKCIALPFIYSDNIWDGQLLFYYDEKLSHILFSFLNESNNKWIYLKLTYHLHHGMYLFFLF